MKLEDKVAIITGAGSGIGRATARRFADEGAALVVNDLRPQYLDELLHELPGDHVVVAGDVSEEATAETLARTARERFGRVDVLVNNVGDLFSRTSRRRASRSSTGCSPSTCGASFCAAST